MCCVYVLLIIRSLLLKAVSLEAFTLIIFMEKFTGVTGLPCSDNVLISLSLQLSRSSLVLFYFFVITERWLLVEQVTA